MANPYSDSLGKSSTIVTQCDVTVVCLCCFWSYFARFDSSQPRCCLLAAIIAIVVFLSVYNHLHSSPTLCCK